MPGGYSMLRAHGYAEWSGGDLKKTIARDSFMCCHCNCHCWVTPGSGKRRGFCLLCAQPTCGRKDCEPCVPVEVMLDNRARGRPRHHRKVVARVEGVPPASTLPRPTGEVSMGGIHLAEG